MHLALKLLSFLPENVKGHKKANTNQKLQRPPPNQLESEAFIVHWAVEDQLASHGL